MPVKVKVYSIPNPKYKSEEPNAEQFFDEAVDSLAEEIGNEFEGGWEITKMAGGDAVLVILFEK